MGFLKRIFGGGDSGSRQYRDTGIYVYARCDNCQTIVRVRIDKQHDLNWTERGHVWHKTIVDNRCFRPMKTVVHFDNNYRITDQELEGGRFVTEADYLASQQIPPDVSQPTDEAGTSQ